MTPLNQAMRMLADAGAIFVGQSVAYSGTNMYADLDGVPSSQRTEFPVAEELQLGYCAGLSLTTDKPIVSVHPRFDFLLRAADQIINHLDKLESMSQGQFRPKVIIRTRVGSRVPLDAGPQHTSDHTLAFRLMLTNIDVLEIKDSDAIFPVYRRALESPRSVLVVEKL